MQFRDFEKIPPDVQQGENTSLEETEPTEGEAESFKLASWLAGLSYPAEKQDILDFLEDQGAGPEILEMAEQLPDTAYNSPTEVSQALAEN